MPGDGESDYQRGEDEDLADVDLHPPTARRKAKRTHGMRDLLRILKAAGVDQTTRDAVEEALFRRYDSIQMRTRRISPTSQSWYYKGHCTRSQFFAPTGTGEWVRCYGTALSVYLREAVSIPMTWEWYRLGRTNNIARGRIKRVAIYLRNWMIRHDWERHWYSVAYDARGVYFRWRSNEHLRIIAERIGEKMNLTRLPPAAGTAGGSAAGTVAEGSTTTAPAESESTPGAAGQPPAQRRNRWPIW
jgi:hypothetical protein